MSFNRSFENTLADARSQFAAHIDWRNRDKADQSAKKSALESLSNTIVARLEGSSHKRPPFTPELPVAAVNELWEQLVAADNDREKALFVELTRQEKLDKLVKQFNNEASEMEAWANKKEEYLTANGKNKNFNKRV